MLQDENGMVERAYSTLLGMDNMQDCVSIAELLSACEEVNPHIVTAALLFGHVPFKTFDALDKMALEYSYHTRDIVQAFKVMMETEGKLDQYVHDRVVADEGVMLISFATGIHCFQKALEACSGADVSKIDEDTLIEYYGYYANEAASFVSSQLSYAFLHETLQKTLSEAQNVILQQAAPEAVGSLWSMKMYKA